MKVALVGVACAMSVPTLPTVRSISWLPGACITSVLVYRFCVPGTPSQESHRSWHVGQAAMPAGCGYITKVPFTHSCAKWAVMLHML